MQRLSPCTAHPLFNVSGTRRIEHAAAAALAPHTLMLRAGDAIARLALALAPHARTVWIACGAGNNGGDGLQAAALLRARGAPAVVSWLGAHGPAAQRLPADVRQMQRNALAAGVPFTDEPPPLGPQDLCIDALLGLGLRAGARGHPPDARLLRWLAAMHQGAAATLCVDLPSGLLADTGQYATGLAPGSPARACRHTLALLTLKPGLFTAQGRDAAGSVWFDDLGVPPDTRAATAWLSAPPAPAPRAHASHKGSFGDVAIVGGEGLARRGMAMTGAALLAASAALHAGAGRVLLSLLGSDTDAGVLTSAQPEVMGRRFDALELGALTVVAGCGGGAAIAAVLPQVLALAPRLVLDADALNAIASDVGLARVLGERAGRAECMTVLTPHPLEAARLLGSSAQAVQADRLSAATALAARFGCTVVLKGSGSVVAAPGRAPHINPTGNARLATAGTGDVLAGLLGARLAASTDTGCAAFDAASLACWQHGAAADHWPAGQSLTAMRLARALTPL